MTILKVQNSMESDGNRIREREREKEKAHIRPANVITMGT